MRILIATTQVPFVKGGAEALAEGLREALQKAGHETEIVAVPFKWHPPEKILDQMLACRLLDLSEAADLLIGLKFPAYLIPHPNKVLWIVHQHRTAYELWDHTFGDLIYAPNGAEIRDAIRQADRQLIPRSKAIFTISINVTRRLKNYCAIDSTPLYHPPPYANQFYSAPAEDYLFFPSLLSPPKRQSLVLEALAQTSQPVRVLFAGTSDRPAYSEELKGLSRKLKVENRVEWLGQVSQEEKRTLYAHALGAIFPPVDEDYGYVTLEAMLAFKPVITCADSGGPLEFVRHKKTGLIAEPKAEDLAAAMDELWENRQRAEELGEAGHMLYDQLDICWHGVVRKLLS
ncbi:MAG TPA: glycosyltransferase family 4 protein [Acidobacteriota bacterium]|jgi:glycosyltransferase involved in cell wall biosynthesis|nr:glycosyltransferase family 4 protein [Acidobacteriota bacterium]